MSQLSFQIALPGAVNKSRMGWMLISLKSPVDSGDYQQKQIIYFPEEKFQTPLKPSGQRQ